MKYFTPQLFVELNSEDPVIADRAEAAWEATQEAYEKHLAVIRSKLPQPVQRIADELSLHDAIIVNIEHSPERAALWVRDGGTLYVLAYALKERLEVARPVRSGVFSAERVRWLYDEVDIVRRDIYCHRVLFSDGHVMTAVFGQLELSVFEIHPVGTHQRLEALDRLAPVFAE